MSVVGIDLGIRKVAMVVLDGESIHPLVFEATADAPRDQQLQQVATYAYHALLLHEPHTIWIEDTIIGNNRKYSIQLAETKGAVLCYLAAMRLMEGADIRLVDNKAWKHEVVGNGNADKEAIRNYIHGTHPAYAPLCGDDQDLYDASCVALYGLRITDRARDLQL